MKCKKMNFNNRTKHFLSCYGEVADQLQKKLHRGWWFNSTNGVRPAQSYIELFLFTSCFSAVSKRVLGYNDAVFDVCQSDVVEDCLICSFSFKLLLTQSFLLYLKQIFVSVDVLPHHQASNERNCVGDILYWSFYSGRSLTV